MTGTKYKNKHKVTSKNKGFRIALVCIGIILAVSLIWSVSAKLYSADSKPDADNSFNNSVIEPIHGQEKTDDGMGEESSNGEVNQELPSNNLETPQDITQAEENGAQAEEPSQSRMQAPQGWLFAEINKEDKTTIVVITHDDRIASKADRIIEIKDGMIKSI